MSDELPSWSEFVLDQCKKMFGTDDLNNEDVFQYFLFALKRHHKKVTIVQDELDGGYTVSYKDPDEHQHYIALYLGNNLDECKKFIDENKLSCEDCEEVDTKYANNTV